jgi:hypothetical protein
MAIPYRQETLFLVTEQTSILLCPNVLFLRTLAVGNIGAL